MQQDAGFLSTRATTILLLAAGLLVARGANAVPSFASQTGMPCSQCHTLSFGPALTAYGRQFKLNGYTLKQGEHPMPLAAMIQGGYSHVATSPPEPLADHFATNDNLSIDQISAFLATRLTDHIGMFAQGTYSGEDRHFSWDNVDIRFATPTTLLGTDAIVGISVNNSPTVQDLWNSTPAWAFPYITSPLVPAVNVSPVISGGLAQLVVGATAYTMIHDHVYLEAGVYKGLSDRWLGNVGLYPTDNPHVNGAAPYWRAVYQWTTGSQENYFSVGTFGFDVKMQPDPTVPTTDHYIDAGLDATWQWTPDGPGTFLAQASLIHEKQQLNATFAAVGSDNSTNQIDALELDVSYVYRKTWSAGAGFFNISGSHDFTLYGPGAFSGFQNGSPDTSGYVLQFECVPFGKVDSWGRPWVNLRLGLQYTGFLKYNGGTSNYDGYGRSAGDNNSLFLFYWVAI